jgi:hypothetical protein
MAAQDYITRVRGLANATVDMFSDSDLLDVLTDNTDGSGVTDVYLAVAVVWEMKAAKYVELVDVSESGSSRKFSDMAKNALLMASRYRDLSAKVEAAVTGRPFTVPIVRPS